MTCFRILAFAAVLSVAVAGPAWASKTVTSAGVKAGETGAEWKSEYIFDDNNDREGAWKQRAAINHGVTSFWQTELEATVERGGRSSDDTEFSSLSWKNKIQLTKQGAYWMDSGLRVSYSLSGTGEADEIEVKALAARDCPTTAHRANLIYSREVGEDSSDDAEWGLSWHSRYKYNDHFQPGFEIYSEFGEIGDAKDFDEQDHRIGPVASGALPWAGASYDAGYLFGASDAAPDGTVKIILKYKW